MADMIKYAYYFYIVVVMYNKPIPHSTGYEDFFQFGFKYTTLSNGGLIRHE